MLVKHEALKTADESVNCGRYRAANAKQTKGAALLYPGAV